MSKLIYASLFAVGTILAQHARPTKPPTGILIDPGHRLSQKLLGWWMFNEGFGIRSTDYSGNGKTATFGNGLAWTGSSHGRGVKFDGSDDFASIGTLTFTDPNRISISVWIRPSSVSIRQTLLGCSDAASGVQMEKDEAKFGVMIAGVFVAVTPPSVLAINEWVHLVYTRNGTGANHILYKNGNVAVLEVNTTDAFVNVGAREIGRRGAGNQNYGGDMEDLRIYDRTLSPLEVRQLYSSPYANVWDRFRLTRRFVPASAAPAPMPRGIIIAGPIEIERQVSPGR